VVARNTFDEIYKQKLMRADRRKAISGAVADIAVDVQYMDGLLGLEEGQYVWILFWLDKIPEEDCAKLQGHPQGDKSKPLRGVFALRSPMRPNPIGLTRVKILAREGGRLTVKGLDAFTGTPVIDIKISSPETDFREL